MNKREQRLREIIKEKNDELRTLKRHLLRSRNEIEDQKKFQYRTQQAFRRSAPEKYDDWLASMKQAIGAK